ncbi:type II secretion system F family protein [Candidatus Nomurabacteria bacterium]|uniref:Type II secretion system F family protein n=1 Tax=Candidatus Dojkabacteria bacterium TaxID=2099670 RepID=A0A955HZS7_9BACT|nr:type II secretion system F family protein [Candidatus Dojkabacteria bacterium]MCB9790373.1 type II secretion system F family protein [Candidatus Nomurabacteria bacterium]MCB9803650.1 type II secretion system F family protein [Candidatus Nomurabacteria bacterium]
MAIQAIKENTSLTSKVEDIVKEDPKDKKKKGVLNKSVSLPKKVNPMDISLTARHLAIMLKSGMSLSEALLVMAEQAPSEKLQEIFTEVHKEVHEGTSMANALKKFPKDFDKIMVSIIDVGEQGGTLERNLLFLADFLKQNHELNSKVKGALMYPVIVLVITVGEMLGVMFFILPKLEDLFSSFGDNLPPTTALMMNVSRFVRENVLMGVIVVVVLTLVSKVLLKTKKGLEFKDNLQLKIPIIKNLNKYHILTNFSRTLGILLESGIPIVASLGIAKEVSSNRAYEVILADIHERVEGGASLSESLGKYPDFFPATYVKMIEVGEETGSLEENLMYLYEFNAEQVGDMSGNLATLLEPLLLVFIGAMIGLLAILIILPIYQLTGSINEGV